MVRQFYTVTSRQTGRRSQDGQMKFRFVESPLKRPVLISALATDMWTVLPKMITKVSAKSGKNKKKHMSKKFLKVKKFFRIKNFFEDYKFLRVENFFEG